MTRHDLRAYQRADIDRILRDRRVLNASEGGLGKTIVASRAIEESGTYPALIVCPPYLVDQWADHLRAEGHPDASIIIAATNAFRDGEIRSITPPEKRELLTQVERDPRIRWLIVNMEMIRQAPIKRAKSVQGIWDKTQEEMGWKIPPSPPGEDALLPPQKRIREMQHYKMPRNLRSLVVDESHRLRGKGERGRGSQQFRGIYQIATRHHIELVQELTATPIYTDVGDLYGQLRILDPRSFTSRLRFLERYAILDEDDWGTHIVGMRPEAIPLLRRYGIVRDYADPDVQLEVPDLIPRTLSVKLAPTTRVAYKKILQEFRTLGNSLITDSSSQLVSLRRLTAADPEKLATLDNLIEDIQNGGYILFTHYRDTAALLAERYQIPLALGGQKGNVALAKSVGPYKGASAFGLAATIDCLQEGVDLSHLRAVIFYEDKYEPGARKQALLRVRRFRPDGTLDPVLVYWIIGRNSIDERVHKVADGRGATAAQLMAGEMTAA